MSRSDSVPAPMVQVPAALLEAVDRMIAVRQDEDPAPFYEAFHEVVAARATLDAATPAASVPATELERLQNHARFTFHLTETLGEPKQATIYLDGSPIFMGRDFSADVAAAEQADKGEAADTPRDECHECKHPKSDHHWVKGGDRWACRGDCSCDIGFDFRAPAAPPEPLCRCRHAKSEHAQGSFSCGRVIEGSGCELHVCSCSVFRYGSGARVPVSDEAEARELTDADFSTFNPKELLGYSYGYEDGLKAFRPEPLCRCGHGQDEHAALKGSCGRLNYGSGCEVHVCSCQKYEPRVPVKDNLDAKLSGRPSDVSDGHSDEAEAWAKQLRKVEGWHHAGLWNASCPGVPTNIHLTPPKQLEAKCRLCGFALVAMDADGVAIHVPARTEEA